MKLIVDKQGEGVIQQLCDIALKQGGINNLNQVNLTLKSIELIPEPKEPQEKPESIIPAEVEN